MLCDKWTPWLLSVLNLLGGVLKNVFPIYTIGVTGIVDWPYERVCFLEMLCFFISHDIIWKRVKDFETVVNMPNRLNNNDSDASI